MALTASEIEIVNHALGHIGEIELDNTTLATDPVYVVCERFYDSARDEIISRHIWNEATEYTILMQDTVAPLHEYTYRFQIPSDCLRILYIGNDLYSYEKVGNYIYTNNADSPPEWSSGSDYIAGQYVNYSDITYRVNSNISNSTIAPDTDGSFTTQGDSYSILNLKYIKRLTDPEDWSELLKNCIALNLAAKISVNLMQDTQLRQSLIQELERLALPVARSIDAQQGTAKPFYNSSWIRARTTQW